MIEEERGESIKGEVKGGGREEERSDRGGEGRKHKGRSERGRERGREE